MFSNRVFQVTFLISLAAHLVILSQNPDFNPFPPKKTEQNLEVIYVQPAKETVSEAKSADKRKLDPFLKLGSRISAKKKSPPPFIDKENIFNKISAKPRLDATFAKPSAAKPDIIAIKKKITLPPIDLDKINNPSYISYYQIIREKIRRAAYYNYTRTESGQVYVSFIISSAGALEDAALVDDKSSQNPYLREVALRSVRDAAPFPAFPRELDYPTLSFNVVISFEIE